MYRNQHSFLAYLLALIMVFNTAAQSAWSPVYAEDAADPAAMETPLDEGGEDLLSLEVPPEPEEAATTEPAIEEPADPGSSEDELLVTASDFPPPPGPPAAINYPITAPGSITVDADPPAVFSFPATSTHYFTFIIATPGTYTCIYQVVSFDSVPVLAVRLGTASDDTFTEIVPDSSIAGAITHTFAEAGTYFLEVANSAAAGMVMLQVASGEENDIDIISMSLGTMEYSQALKDACDAAYATGLLLFAAAGNNGDQVDKSINYPAAFSSVIAVGATDDSDQRASFSAIGPELELMAPGDSILSTYPNTSLGSQVHLVGEQPDGLYEYDLYSGDLIDSGLGTVTADVIFCGEATDTSVISAALTAGGIAPGEDWIALIDRGDSTFAEKTATVMNLGADAVIIINNDTASPDAPGAFTLDDGATVPPGGAWVPTVSVSYNAGEMIRDAVHLNGTVKVGYDPYKTISGTSMATPYAAGAAAVIWSLAPELANAEIREVLSGTALDLGLLQSQQGNGLIQLNAALDLAEGRASDQVLALSSLQHDASAGVAQADLELRVLPGTQGQVFFALYDAAGRFLACTATPVVTEEYAQALSVSTTYSTVNTAAKAKAFFVTEGIDPLGLSLEIPLP